MRPNERDDLLIRLDERTINIYKLTEAQESHLRELNQRVSKNVLHIDRNDKRLLHLEEGVNLKFTKKQIAAGSGSIMTVVATLIVAIGKIAGWW